MRALSTAKQSIASTPCDCMSARAPDLQVTHIELQGIGFVNLTLSVSYATASDPLMPRHAALNTKMLQQKQESGAQKKAHTMDCDMSVFAFLYIQGQFWGEHW